MILKQIFRVCKYPVTVNFRSNCSIMASAEKKPRQNVYKPQLNYRNIPSRKFIPGAGPNNRVDTIWNPNNDDISDYSKMTIQDTSGNNINISEELFNIQTSARTRIFHIESGIERVNKPNYNYYDYAYDNFKLKIIPSNAIINNGEEIDDECCINSIRVPDIKHYLLVALHNLDRLVTNNVTGLFPRCPLVIYSLSAMNEYTYELVVPPADKLMDCYKLLLQTHPYGAEQFVNLNFEKERLNERLERDIIEGKNLDFEWPVGYQFSIEDGKGSAVSITNIFAKRMIPFKQTERQATIYKNNVAQHRRGQLGSVISRRGMFIFNFCIGQISLVRLLDYLLTVADIYLGRGKWFFTYLEFVSSRFCLLFSNLTRLGHLLTIPKNTQLGFQYDVFITNYFNTKCPARLKWEYGGDGYLVVLVWLFILVITVFVMIYNFLRLRIFSGYPCHEFMRISNLMDLPCMEFVCKAFNLLKILFHNIIIGLLGMYSKFHYALEDDEALTKLRQVKASTLANCPLALRQLQDQSIRFHRNPRVSKRPLDASEYRQQLLKPAEPSFVSPTPSTDPTPSPSNDDNGNLSRRLAFLEQQQSQNVTYEGLRDHFKENNLEILKDLTSMKQSIESNSENSLKLLERQTKLENLCAQNTLRSSKNEALLGTLASYMVAINPKPLKTKNFSEAFKPVLTHDIGNKLAAAIEASKRIKELEANRMKYHKSFNQLPEPTLPVKADNPPIPLPQRPYHAAITSDFLGENDEDSVMNLNKVEKLVSKVDHTNDAPAGDELAVASDPKINGDFQLAWSPTKPTIPKPVINNVSSNIVGQAMDISPVSHVEKAQPQPSSPSVSLQNGLNDLNIFKVPKCPKTPENNVHPFFNQNSPSHSKSLSKPKSNETLGTPTKRKRTLSPATPSKRTQRNKELSVDDDDNFLSQSILNHPLFNRKQYLDNLVLDTWPTFFQPDFKVQMLNPENPQYSIFYYLSLGFPNFMFEILKTAAETDPFISLTNPLQVSNIRSLIDECKFILDNNFALLCAALSNEITHVQMLNSGPDELFVNFPSIPISTFLGNHILTAMYKLKIPIPNISYESAHTYLRVLFVIDHPNYMDTYFTAKQQEWIKKFKKRVVSARKNKSASSIIAKSTPLKNFQPTSPKAVKKPRSTRSLFPTKDPLVPSTSTSALIDFSDLDESDVNSTLTTCKSESKLSETPSKKEKLATAINKLLSFQKNLKVAPKGEIWSTLSNLHFTLTSESIPANYNIPHAEQVHHSSGEQAADKFFSLDGFMIPQHINELMLHPKTPSPKPNFNFSRPSSNENLDALSDGLRSEIMTKLIKDQTNLRNKEFQLKKIPKLDSNITIVSTNLNAPVKQLYKLIQNTDNPSIVCVNELKLTKGEILKGAFYPPSYTPYFTTSSYKNHEFVFSLILVSNSLKCSIKQIKTAAPFTMVDIQFQLSNSELATINVCTFYRPHHKSKFQKLLNIQDSEYHKFFENQFTKIIDLQRGKTSVLTGDLNCQYLDPRPQDNKPFAKFFQHKTSHYIELVKSFTNFPSDKQNNGNSTIDICLVQNLKPSFKQFSGRKICGNDGHSIFKLEYDLKCVNDFSVNEVHTFTKTTPIAIYNKSLELLALRQPKLHSLRIEAMKLVEKRKKEGTFEPLESPIEYISEIIQLCEDVMNELVNPITIRINKFAPNPKLTTATKHVRDEYHNLKRLSLERPLTDSELIDYYSASKNLPKMMRHDRKMHLTGYIENNQSNLLTQSQKYRVNRDFNKKNKDSLDPSLDLEKLTKIFEKQLDTFREKPFKDYNFNTQVKTKLGTKDFQIRWYGKTKRDSIYKAFLQSRDTTCGYNSKLNKNVMGCFSNKYIPLLVDLVYICLEAGYFPHEFKESKVVAINKCKLRVPSKDTPIRVRWLGIQKHILAPMMKFVSANFVYHLDTNHLLPVTQHAFRPGFSTSTALNEIFLRLNLTPKSKGYPILIMIDIMKAFDSICHKLLAKKLDEICEPNIARFLIEDHTNRTSYVVHNGKASAPIKNPQYGVYQGGCLSPPQFSLFLFDFSLSTQFVPDTDNVLYADDLSLVTIAKIDDAPAQIMKIENQVRKHLEQLNLKMLPGKTAVLIIGMNDKIKFDSDRETSTCTKLLGVTFKSNLFDPPSRPKTHPFSKEIFLRCNKLRECRGTLFYIEHMGYRKFLKQLAYQLAFGNSNYALDTLPTLPAKLYNKLNKHISQIIIDTWKLDQFPRIQYEYSYLFQLANWHNAQNSHCYSSLNYLNRILMTRSPPNVYRETINILEIDSKPFPNPNSQLSSERKDGFKNFSLGKSPSVNIKTQVRSKHFFPFNLDHFFKQVPSFVLSHLGFPSFKPLLNNFLKSTCNHRAGKDCKYCSYYSTHFQRIKHQHINVSRTSTVSNLYITASTSDAHDLIDQLNDFAFTIPYLNVNNPSDFYLKNLKKS